MEKIEFYRNELDNLIKARGYDLSDEEVVKKSIEIENIVYGFCSETKKSV